MPGSSQIRAGGAFIELTTEDAALRAGLDRAQERLRAFGASLRVVGTEMAAMGAAILAPIILIAKNFAEMGAQMARAATKAGVSVETMSALSYAAQQTGVEVDSLETALFRMGKNLSAAASGAKEPTDALDKLGLTIAQLKALAPDQQFALIADRISKLGDESTKAGVGSAIFGRGVVALMPLIEQGAAGIDAMTARAKALGLVMSGQDAQAALTLTQRMSDLWDTIRMTAFAIGAAMAPTLESLTKQITGAIHSVVDFANAHRGLVLAVTEAAAGVGVALAAIGTAFTGVGLAIGGYLTVIKLASIAGASYAKQATAVVAANAAEATSFGVLGASIATETKYMAEYQTMLFGETAAATAAIGTAAAATRGWLASLLELAGGFASVASGIGIFKIALDGWQGSLDAANAKAIAAAKASTGGAWVKIQTAIGVTPHTEFVNGTEGQRLNAALDVGNLPADAARELMKRWGAADVTGMSAGQQADLLERWRAELAPADTAGSSGLTTKQIGAGMKELTSVFKTFGERVTYMSKIINAEAAAHRRLELEEMKKSALQQREEMKKTFVSMADGWKNFKANIADDWKIIDRGITALFGPRDFESVGTFNKQFINQIGPSRGEKKAAEIALNTKLTSDGVVKLIAAVARGWTAL